MGIRGSGILLHITSLPSPYGIGDFGSEAYRFLDFLAEAKQSYWQILPLNPTEPAFNNSPYHSRSAFAYNKLLLSPELMVQDGLLKKEDVDPVPPFPKERVDYEEVIAYKKKLFHKALERFKKIKNNNEYEKFCSQNSGWLEDFSLFVVLKGHFQGLPWSDWPLEIRDRQSDAIQALRKKLHDKIEMEKFLQYIFIKQWFSLKGYCHQKGIHIIGDMPIYVDYDSVDVWTHPELFKLDSKKKPYAIAGVPPDYFSETGQLWGNPIYNWDALKKRGYDWWIQRIEHNLRIFDIIRVDHFRGFVGYWEVPATEDTALNGKWIEAPAVDFFNQLNKRFRYLPIIAEDLGTITPDVIEIMHRFEFPGMKVLLFAFGEDNALHPYLPHTYEKNYVVYTGTHDNNTVRGWFEREAKPDDKRRLFRYLGREVSKRKIHWEFIRLAMLSVADKVIIPMQDVLGLGEKARMNRPATGKGNWRWRLLPGQIKSSIAEKLLDITKTSGRA
jgi:4-alpha-glucanotransferase